MNPRPKSYAEAGVDLAAGDVASRIMFEASKRTWSNRKGLAGDVACAQNSFSSVRFVHASRFPDAIVGMNFDGVGTKLEIAERLGDFRSVAHDLFAMVCDDASIRGAEPILVGSILDCNKVVVEVVEQLAEGMVEAAKEARVAVINGEIAELGERVRGYGAHCANWGASVLWISKSNRIITGEAIEPGQAIVAFRELGVRSNGLSLIRRVFGAAYGPAWHEERMGDSTLGRAALVPSRIYTRAIVDVTGGVCGTPKASVTGMAHITGGGIPGKLGRLLRVSGYGAILDRLYEPCEVMRHCQLLAGISNSEAYRTWNMGQGLLIVTPTPTEIIQCAIPLGFEAREVGVVQEAPVVEILAQHLEGGDSERLTYPTA